MIADFVLKSKHKFLRSLLGSIKVYLLVETFNELTLLF